MDCQPRHTTPQAPSDDAAWTRHNGDASGPASSGLAAGIPGDAAATAAPPCSSAGARAARLAERIGPSNRRAGLDRAAVETDEARRASAEPCEAPAVAGLILPSIELPVATWGYARAGLDEFDALRKRLPDWAPESTPDHFFRYADEQTVLASRALDEAIRRIELTPLDYRNWGIVAAPEFLGRQHVAAFLDRYQRNGGPRVSPNSIVQHSLHSVSGALSILLDCRGPNVGAGGGRRALSEGLLSVLTLFDDSTFAPTGDTTGAPTGPTNARADSSSTSTTGCWLVATTWDPLPLPDEQGRCAVPAVCHAAVLGLSGSAGRAAGKLRLEGTLVGGPASVEAAEMLQVTELIQTLEQYDRFGRRASRAWRLSWGASLRWEWQAPTAGLRRVA